MKVIHVLSPGFTSPNSAAFLFPLIKFDKALKNQGYQLKHFKEITAGLTDCDFLMIDSKYFKHHWAKDFDGTLTQIDQLNQKTKVIWCDQSDSTGTFLGQVLPHVHKYLKAQILKDKSLYQQSFYGSRIFTDYYNKNNAIQDKEPYIDQPVKNSDDIKKIGVSWNSGLMNYGVFGPYIPRIRNRLPLNTLLYFASAKRSASAPRALDITCRMGISYSRETVCYQRKKMREILSDHVQTNKLSRSEYLKEMSNSKICASPFGLGEITLKDFECFLSGSLLLKPDMSHMDTWPNFYVDDETCITHNWDLHDVKEKISWALSHEQNRIEIAQQGQKRYLEYTCKQGAAARFAKHFESIILSET